MTDATLERHAAMILEHIANIEMYANRVQEDAEHYARQICAEALEVAGHARTLRAAARR